MNNWTIAGNLGGDAELRFTKGGTPVLGFSVGVDVYKGPNTDRETMWVDCSVWGDRAEALQQYLTKGTKVTVSGEAGLRTYLTKSGEPGGSITLKVDKVTLQGTRQQEGGGERGGQSRGAPSRGGQQRPARPQQANRGGEKYGGRGEPPPSNENPFPDDDIPF